MILPLQYQFFVHGLIAASLVGGVCGIIGVYIVLRKMSYIGHGLSHAIFGGAVVSFVMQFNFYLGAGLWGAFSLLLINLITRRRKIGADAAIGVITTAGFAIGVALMSRHRSFTKNLEAALFGNILGVTTEALWMITAVAVTVVLLTFLFYRPLLFSTFDAEVAQTYGVPVRWIDTLFTLMLAATIIASMQVMGVTLIAAAIVIPAITARLWTDSFHKMIFLSAILGVFCSILGMYMSFYLNISSSATIVLVSASLFAVGYLIHEVRQRKRPAIPAVTQDPLQDSLHNHPHDHHGFSHVHEHAHPDLTPHHGKEKIS